MQPWRLLFVAGSIAKAAQRGFNYDANHANGSVKHRNDFASEFRSAQKLVGGPGFASARLYTMIQSDTNKTIEAVQAAIDTETSLLLGLWSSAGVTHFQQELEALNAAITDFGSALATVVVGIAVGSEDIYRTTDRGKQSDAGPGLSGPDLINQIQQVRALITSTPLRNVPVGHVDTYNTWIDPNLTGQLISACDFVGVDAYPYYESDKDNGIDNAAALFFDDMKAVAAAAPRKAIWVTETGWPVQGNQSNRAVASPDNAAKYYRQVACQLFSQNINTWWFILQDAQSSNDISFAITGPGSPPPVTPLFNLTC